MNKEKFKKKLNRFKCLSEKKGAIKNLNIQESSHFTVVNEQAQLQSDLEDGFDDINSNLLAVINYLNELLKAKDAEIMRLQTRLMEEK